MHPASILSYYPTYQLLDEIVSHNDYKSINLYIDLKNCLQSLYMEHAIVNILESTLKSGKTNSSIFESVISFLGFNKLYTIKRKLNLKVYLFFESGVSFYHKNISKKYKISRRIDDLYGLDKEKREIFFGIIQKNLGLVEQCCNKLPNTYVVRLHHLEADFIPYYLIRNKIVCREPSTAHIVFSNDHDMLQTLTAGEHTFVFQKHAKSKKVRRRGEALLGELKVENDLPDEVQPLAMSILGDPGDDVDGIKGIGQSRFLANSTDLLRATGGIQQLYQNVMKGKPIFDPTSIRNPNKYLNKILDEGWENP